MHAPRARAGVVARAAPAPGRPTQPPSHPDCCRKAARATRHHKAVQPHLASMRLCFCERRKTRTPIARASRLLWRRGLSARRPRTTALCSSRVVEFIPRAATKVRRPLTHIWLGLSCVINVWLVWRAVLAQRTAARSTAAADSVVFAASGVRG